METKLYSNGNLITTRIFRISPDPREYFGADGIILLLFMVITIPLMLITSTIGVVIGIFLALVMAALLMIYVTGTIIGTASSITLVIIAGGILIWKISARGG